MKKRPCIRAVFVKIFFMFDYETMPSDLFTSQYPVNKRHRPIWCTTDTILLLYHWSLVYSIVIPQAVYWLDFKPQLYKRKLSLYLYLMTRQPYCKYYSHSNRDINLIAYTYYQLQWIGHFHANTCMYDLYLGTRPKYHSPLAKA